VEQSGVTPCYGPQAVEGSALEGRASSGVVPRGFACHAEGRGFESHHPLSGTRWKRRVFALRAWENATAEASMVRFWSGLAAWKDRGRG
jgi:hypothetical protein